MENRTKVKAVTLAMFLALGGLVALNLSVGAGSLDADDGYGSINWLSEEGGELQCDEGTKPECDENN